MTRRRSIFAGDIWAMAWPILCYGIRPLLLYLRRRPQHRDPAFTEPDLFA